VRVWAQSSVSLALVPALWGTSGIVSVSKSKQVEHFLIPPPVKFSKKPI